VLQTGGGCPTILNAANEIAVEAFLHRRVGFLEISRIVERVLSRLGSPNIDTLDEVIALDATARRVANSLMQVVTA
jgi:1-deoxy-D-xylulose-5-phosphate reductoisomerase